MKKTILFALAALFAGSAMAQEAQEAPKPQTETSPDKVLKPHFTAASIKIPLPDRYAGAYPEIHDGLIAVYHNGTLLYYNLDGKCVYGTDFPIYIVGENAYFSDGVLVARRSGGGYDRIPMLLKPDGTYRDFPTGAKSPSGLDNDFSLITSFKDGVALAQRGGMWNRTQVFVDKNFKEIVGAPKFSVKSTFGDTKLYPVVENRRLFYNPQTSKYGYLDAKGAMAITSQFDKAHNFSDGMAAVMITDAQGVKKWGFIDTTGKMVIPATYRVMPGRFTEGVAPVRIGNDESNFVMNYIDKSGKRLMPESVKRNLNEFHNGYAWVGMGCDKLYVMNRNFVETRDMTQDFYHSGNGFGVCMFKMQYGAYPNYYWGIDFPGGMQMLNQGGIDEGDIFAPDGTLLYAAVDARGYDVSLNYPTAGDLMFCKVRIYGEPDKVGSDSEYIECFVNTRGEIAYYFVEGYEGFEGTVPVKK